MDIQKISDEKLVEIIREKNQELFEQIVARYQNKIYSYISRLIGNREEAEDLTQEVFVKVFKNLYGFDIKRKFSSWIYRIAHNEAVNYIKKKSYFKILSIEQNEFLQNTMSTTENLVENIIKKENAKKIRELLGKLSFKYKEVLVLRYLEEKSYDEISDILRMPVNTVGTLINRAKGQLEKIVKKENLELSNF
jgi:RNA polymerase sigma-70 factor (ECF subfamily)